jgi:hypothetical protein
MTVFVALVMGFLLGGPAARLDIKLVHGSPAEVQTRDQVQRLVNAYDVSPWLYTTSILIDEQTIPHSHPVLTLHTRHLKDDELLLSTFVHEQLHWFFVQKGEMTQQAIQDLRRLFPRVPVGAPDGAVTEESSYLHLMVCYTEYQAIRRLLGELKAREVMEFWASDHYRWIYSTMLDRPGDIGDVLARHDLIPLRDAEAKR